MADARTTKPPKRPRKSRQKQQLLITGGVMAGIAVVGGIAVAILATGGGEPPATPPRGNAPGDQARVAQAADARANDNSIGDSARAEANEAPPSGPTLVPDDGRTLWASPTAGEPVALEWLPPGVQLILSVRLADLLDTADGRIVAEQFAERLRPIAKAQRLREVRRLTVGIRPGAAYGELEATIVVEPRVASTDTDLPKRLGRCVYGEIKRVAPAVMVIASAATHAELAESDGEPPPLRREMEQLAAASDGDRHASLLVAPSFLFAEGKPLFAGGVAALESPLFEELPDDLRGVLASVHWSDARFYWEVRAAAKAETTATRLATRFTGRVRKWPGELQLALLELNPAPHGRRVVANLPAMVRVAAEYTRRGVEDRHAVLNGYLPPTAGHNLLLAADLMLAQQSAGGGGGPAVAATAAAAPRTAADKLRQPATVVFARDTLEMAVKYLSDEISVPMVILGGDLQLEGITKNQSFALDQADKPGQAVLVEILRRANPDKTASGPADPKQKLVYVIKPDADGRETIFITTRASAAKRSDRLPSVFTP